jgi:hypothetical protein
MQRDFGPWRIDRGKKKEEDDFRFFFAYAKILPEPSPIVKQEQSMMERRQLMFYAGDPIPSPPQSLAALPRG